MPEFLTNQRTVRHAGSCPDLTQRVEKLIESAQDELLLLRPYLKFSESVRGLLLDRDRQYCTRILCRRGKSFERVMPQVLKDFSRMKVQFSRTLHAKCYVNEQTAVVTSMNLHEYSQENNDEFGFIITSQQDPKLFEQIRLEARRLMDSDKNTSAIPPNPTRAVRELRIDAAGFCIRCGEHVPLDVKRPLCREDFRIWARYEDDDFPEEYCHRCGEPRETCVRKPLCRACFRSTGDAAP